MGLLCCVMQETVRCVVEYDGGGIYIRPKAGRELLGVRELLVELKLRVYELMPIYGSISGD